LRFFPEEIIGAYFTPGRERFALIWQNWNPHSRSLPNSQIAAEIRLDPSQLIFGNQGKLTVDLSVRQLAVEEKNDPRHPYSIRGSVELTDFVFGSNCHHLLLAEGNYEECQALIRATMSFLNLDQLIKTTAEIPWRKNLFDHRTRRF